MEIVKAFGSYSRSEGIEINERPRKERIDTYDSNREEQTHADVLRGVGLRFISLTCTDAL